MDRMLLIDKPAGWTSFDVVAKIRGAARNATGNRKIKVGHAGTLDPFATGLLIVLVGKETKNQDMYMKGDKEYLATVKLGYNSSTGDPEGEIVGISDFEPKESEIQPTLEKFVGEIEQIPPIYSAIKVDGKRAYKLARAGEAPKLKPRKVRINDIKIIRYEYPLLEIIVSCSSGTYIRTLAEDIGKKFNTGGYLTELRRTKIGTNTIEKSLNIEQAIEDISGQTP